jgi:hypothetical protein
MKFACEMEIQLYASEPLMKLITTYFYWEQVIEMELWIALISKS